TFILTNRRMRTRLYGGVGGSAAKAAPYPDYCDVQRGGRIRTELISQSCAFYRLCAVYTGKRFYAEPSALPFAAVQGFLFIDYALTFC
ncbi:hypothetical protein, partial [Candidatus Aquicultor secundus]|uniref:hypothetical protein n=2 Tax=Candidatus Aquicultor secundus TaxID=1973895 RepID=UPI00257D01A0